MKAQLKKMSKYPVTIWMLVSVFTLCAVMMGYSAYNGTVDVKRVISTQASSTFSFSSNYMESGSLTVKNLRTTAEGNFICNVTVCNYDQLDPSSPAHASITYDFKAELVKYDLENEQYVLVSNIQMNDENNAKTFYVKKVMDNNEAITTDTEHSINTSGFTYTYLSETLTGGTSYKDSFDICFDSTEVEKAIPELFIRVTATPTEESIRMNSGVPPMLSSVISISKGRTVETGWHGALDESSTSDYDGYNLIVEGSGSGTIDIRWDSREFTINPAFLTNNSSKLTSVADAPLEGWKKVTLTVNSTEENRYVIQFYKQKTNVSYTGNNFPSKYIVCENYIATVNTATP